LSFAFFLNSSSRLFVLTISSSSEIPSYFFRPSATLSTGGGTTTGVGVNFFGVNGVKLPPSASDLRVNG